MRDRAIEWPLEHVSAAALLLRAASLAQSLQRGPWDLAVQIDELRQLGLSHADLRVLVFLGLLEHAEEVSTWPATNRSFQPTARLTFSSKTCFVLTELGEAAAHARLQDHSSTPQGVSSPASRHPPSANGANGQPVSSSRTTSFPSAGNGDPLSAKQLRLAKPSWNRELRCLCFENLVVKEFRKPAPNQELILAVFEEDDWPPRIDDPLPPEAGLESKRRLRETIAGLNRCQHHQLLRFAGDGSGRGIRWFPIHAHEQHAQPSPGRSGNHPHSQYNPPPSSR